MNFLHRYRTIQKPVETCVVGSGGFGRSFLSQAQRMPLVNARVAVDRTVSIAVEALTSIGIAPQDIAPCQNAEQAQHAWQAGKCVAVDDVQHVLALPIDLVIEATGNPEAGARNARLAIDAGRHVMLTSKEVDSVVGPELARRAQAVGKVVTPVDGDQPSLLIGLITWAQTLGLEIVAAGKSSEYDFVFDEHAGTMASNGAVSPVAGFSSLFALGEREVTDLMRARSLACQALPQRAVPDLCELQVVANSTGLSVDVPALHAPIARPAEVPTVLTPTQAGGLLGTSAVLDVFHCLRRPDELSFAGGVFVVVRCEDDASWTLLHEKGHVLSRDHRHAMLYLPRHLLGLESATSVLDAVIFGESSGAQQPLPRLDLVARATVALHAGSVLAMGGHHHSIAGVLGELRPAATLAHGTPVPFYLAANRRLLRDVPAGGLICLEDVDLDPQSELFKLRQSQDAHFF